MESKTTKTPSTLSRCTSPQALDPEPSQAANVWIMFPQRIPGCFCRKLQLGEIRAQEPLWPQRELGEICTQEPLWPQRLNSQGTAAIHCSGQTGIQFHLAIRGTLHFPSISLF